MVKRFIQFIGFVYVVLLIFAIPSAIALAPSIIYELTGKEWVLWFYFISMPVGIGTMAFIGEQPELFFRRW